MPIKLPEAAPLPVREVRQRIYQAIQKQAHYLLTTVHPWSNNTSMLLLTESKSTEHWIRPNCGAVEGFSFLWRFGPYDPHVTGVSRAELLRGTIVPMIRYLVTTHVSGGQPTSDGKKWGDAWQSAYWAQMLGRGAWWIWPELPADLRSQVRQVVAHEAQRIAQAVPPHQLRYDTKAEENAWNSEILSVAMLLMPDDPRRALWETTYQKWVLSSFLRPADQTNAVVVDGRPVKDQFTGANLFDDYTLENHGFVHPDYMTCFSLSLGCAPDFAMTGRPWPEALLFNVPPIYENLKWMLLPDGGFVYPSGQDWELFRNASWLGKHVLMAVYGHDPEAWGWTLRNLEVLEKMQARSPSGAIYFPGEYFFASTQHDIFRSLANAWLNLQLAKDIPQSSRERLGVRRWDSGRIILRRTATAIHTVSWGSRVMAQCAPLALDRVVSPHERSGVGFIQLSKNKKPLAVSLHDASVKHGEDWFEARLEVDHGTSARAHLTFRSETDGSLVIQEKLVALTNLVTTEIATGLIGILNNTNWIYETGKRRLRVDQNSIEVPSGCGRQWTWDNASRIRVEDALEITSAQPLQAAYLAAQRPERGRATDRLVLNHLPNTRTWKSGQVISQFRVVIRSMSRSADDKPRSR
jgi:hypothetical protein